MTAHRYRVFAQPAGAARALLSLEDRHHLERVLRMREGDDVEAVVGGRLYRARVAGPGLELLDELPGAVAAPPLTVWIAQPGARSDTAVEKLTEIGVAAIGALRSDATKGDFTQARLGRWRRVAEAAARQARRELLPEILDPRPFDELVGPELIVLDPTGGELAPAGGAAATAVAVGPEPGFTTRELALAAERGAPVSRLGPPVLRVETAAVVAAAVLLRELGYLR